MLSTVRHNEIFPAHEHNQPITIIGAGAIGSRLYATLIELGLTRITVYDHDVVEPHNLSNQLFLNEDVGRSKVLGLISWTQRKTGLRTLPNELQHRAVKVDKDTHLKGFVFLLVDSFDARRTIFKDNIRRNPDVHRVIDCRMAATHGNIYTFDPHLDGDLWHQTLGDDAQAEVSACGAPFSVAPTAAVMAKR